MLHQLVVDTDLRHVEELTRQEGIASADGDDIDVMWVDKRSAPDQHPHRPEGSSSTHNGQWVAKHLRRFE
jgi:hypothetical protein